EVLRYEMPTCPAAPLLPPSGEPSLGSMADRWWCQPRVTSSSWCLLLNAPEYRSDTSLAASTLCLAYAEYGPTMLPGSPAEVPLPPAVVGVPYVERVMV